MKVLLIIIEFIYILVILPFRKVFCLTTKEKELELKKNSIISWIVFLATLVVVLITLITIVFPAFLLGSTSGIKYPIQIDIFETGIWTYQLLLTNFIVFGLLILHYKNKLPQKISQLFKFIFNFEVSKKVALLVIVVLLVIYIPFNVAELSEPDPWIDYTRYVKRTLDQWTFTEFSGGQPFAYVSFSLGKISGQLFDHYAALASLTSISLLVLTYLITYEISKKRFAGLVAMIIALQSSNFLIYDTTITYPNFWVLFILLSLYFMYKAWPLSSITFLLAVGSKVIAGFFLPSIMFFAFRAKIPKRRKIIISSIYGVILISGFVGVVMLQIDVLEDTRTGIKFDTHKFLSGFTAFAYEFRFDGLIILFLLPLTVGLFIASRNGIKEADSFLALILGILLTAAILPAITAFTNNPYRFMPLVFFFAIGVGILFSKIPVKLDGK